MNDPSTWGGATWDAAAWDAAPPPTGPVGPTAFASTARQSGPAVARTSGTLSGVDARRSTGRPR